MPEGPEIKRAAELVAAAIEGRVAEEVFFAFDELKEFEAVFTGQTIEEVTTRGKAMLTRFAGGLAVYSHNQLYGRWYVMRNGRFPRTGRQLRFGVRAGDRRVLLYSASDIEVLDAEAERVHPYLSRLGPDVLSQAHSVDDLASRLADARFRRRQLGALLLDQRFVAGLGNYLRAEILFEAGIHPRRRALDCTVEERTRLAQKILALTKRAYRTRGVTLAPSLAAQLTRAGEPRSASRFWVYGRDGESCRVCAGDVVVAVIGGRNCFWCPGCQPE